MIRNEKALEVVLELRALEYCPIPCFPNRKKSIFPWKEFQSRLPSEEEIVQWFAEWPNANIAIVTGEASGIDVIDFDRGHDPWPPPNRQLPRGLVVKSPRGGYHLYFRHTMGVTISRGALAKKVDVRADGGYIVVPPSIFENNSYTIESGSFSTARDTIAPDWLKKELIACSSNNNKFMPPDVISEGERNDTLFKHAVILGKRGLLKQELLSEIISINKLRCRPPLPENELRTIVESALKYATDDKNSIYKGSRYFEKRTFIPLRLAKDLARKKQYCFGYDGNRGTGQLMEYKKGVWRRAIDVEVDAQRLLGEHTKNNRIKDAIGALEREVERRPWTHWNIERQYINCTNGLLDPRSQKLYKSSAEFYSTFQLPVAWNSNTSENRVDSFLNELLPPDEVQILLEIIGYLATCDISAKHLFILEGEGDNGKTELLTLIKNFIGMRNISIVSIQDLADNRFAPANLENKQLALFDDISELAIKNSSILKVLTGKFSTIRVEHKGVDAYEAPLYARLLFTCNVFPRSYDHSSAWYQRPLIIPFKNTFTGDDIDLGLAEELAKHASLERLLFLSVQALTNLIERKFRFVPTPSMMEAKGQYRIRTDTVTSFVEEECILSSNESVNKGVWYNRYAKWCEGGNDTPLGRNKAYDRLKNLYGIRSTKSV